MELDNLTNYSNFIKSHKSLISNFNNSDYSKKSIINYFNNNLPDYFNSKSENYENRIFRNIGTYLEKAGAENEQDSF